MYSDLLFDTPINYSNITLLFIVCESCIEPIPTCSHGEILAVDLNTTNSCCPEYHCGKCECVCVWRGGEDFVSVSEVIVYFHQHLQCVMSTYALTHL